MSLRPDPRRSYALIIGVSEYAGTGYEDRDEVATTARKMTSLIKSSDMWSLDDANVSELTGAVRMRDAAAAVKAISKQAADAILVYFCGHGIKYTNRDAPDHDLHLAFSDSVHEWYFTHLPFQAVRRMLRDSKAAARVLILDCCYAKGSFLSGPGSAPAPEVQGVCTMIATKDDRRALAEWGDSGYTGFSGALIEVIETGIDGAEQALTPHSVFRQAHSMLLSREFPEPDMRGNANTIFLCDNRGYREPAPDVPYETLLRRLNDPGQLDLAAYAKAVADMKDEPSREARADGGRHQRAADKAIHLISAFCASRDIDEAWQLATALRSGEDLGDYADEAISRILIRSSPADVGELVHLLHQQRGTDLDLGGVLAALQARPGRHFSEILTALNHSACADCGVIGARLQGRLTRVTTAGPWLIDALAAL